MRVGYNPHKDQLVDTTDYLHQVVLPVYIPNQEGYFKDSFQILKLCLDSLLATVHSKTFISVVNNGSCNAVEVYLSQLYEQKLIQELIHTENIGKLNAVLKGITGNTIELVTITDADVLFLNNWQRETRKVFHKVPKAGVVGIVPQFKMYENHCGNVLLANLVTTKMRFCLVKNPEALVCFYDSLGWDRNYNRDYVNYNLALVLDPELKVWIGSGHFVATYRKDLFENKLNYIGYKMGGDSEEYLDTLPLKKDYWRLTTEDNYAYHMGNTLEKWMVVPQKDTIDSNFSSIKGSNKKQIHRSAYFFKNRLFVKFLSVRWMKKLFLYWKKLPKERIDKY